MTNKIFRSILTVAIAVLLAALVVITGCMYRYFDSVQASQLRAELDLAAAGVEQLGTDYLQDINSTRFRLTLVDDSGAVLYDTQTDAAEMENHSNREEIQEALQSGSGSSSRYSETLTEETLYEARRLSDGTVLRVSVSRATAATLILGMLQPILLVALAAIILSALLARRMAQRIVEPLNKLDLEHPLENEAYEELSPLLHRIHSQHRQITAQLQVLRQKTNEFEQVTGSMREGLVLLDAKGIILSMNPAAQALFQTDSSSVGQDFLTVDRSHSINAAIEQALGDGHCEIRGERNGREYQFDLSRIESDGTTLGAVLLAFDVTEQAYAEQRRREFTANVSHELKTPLQSILGSAELMENGLVAEQDMPRFVGHIRREAARLVTLIDDIIRLSQLDEGGKLPREEVLLSDLAAEVLVLLGDAAAAKNVRFSVSGEGTVNGVRRLLYEILYNLCDNAIKYNVDGGSVHVDIVEQEEDVTLTVRDTGIGIPPEHHTRVFERFYRVDKSHSKQSGGTGLGLSIVKHAAQYHRAKLSLDSEPGTGTAVTVAFPKSSL